MERILITDVTQMRDERLCVAGLNIKRECVRLDVPYPGIYKYLLYRDGWVIRPRVVINATIQPDEKCEAPHIEDYDWLEPENTTFEYLADDSRWHKILSEIAFESVGDIFEADFADNRKIAHKQGARSLGTIKIDTPIEFSYRQDVDHPSGYRSRLSFEDGAGEAFYRLPIVELTMLYHTNFLREKERMSIQQVENFINVALQDKEIWLRVGLTRAMRDRDGELRHYLQIAGIFTFPDYLYGRCFADFDV